MLDLEYDELIGWMEYFRRRPAGWQADNRAAIIAMSMGGGKLRPEDLFDSLRAIQEDNRLTKEKSSTFAEKFFERFSTRFTEGNPYDPNDDRPKSATLVSDETGST